MNGKELKAIIDSLIGDRRRHPDDDSQWRVRYGHYEKMEADDCAKRVKKIAKKWKRDLGCIWTADTMRGAMQDWAARKHRYPIAFGAITSTYYHHEHAEYGHRYNIVIDPDDQLWLIEASWHSLPWEEMCFPLAADDGDFWDLYA